MNRLAEINLTDRLTLLEVIYSKYNKTPPKYLVQKDGPKALYEQFEDKEFVELVKFYWVTGKWLTKEADELRKVYKASRLFQY